MQIFLSYDLASAGGLPVISPNERGIKDGLITWILSPINESKKVAIIEIAEALCLINNENGHSNPLHDLRCQLET